MIQSKCCSCHHYEGEVQVVSNRDKTQLLKLLKGKFFICNRTFNMLLHSVHSNLPKSPKYGARSGMNLHSILCTEQNSEIRLYLLSFQKVHQFRYLITMLLPLLLQMSDGFPQRKMNLLNEEINASVIKSEVSSKCTALIE